MLQPQMTHCKSSNQSGCGGWFPPCLLFLLFFPAFPPSPVCLFTSPLYVFPFVVWTKYGIPIPLCMQHPCVYTVAWIYDGMWWNVEYDHSIRSCTSIYIYSTGWSTPWLLITLMWHYIIHQQCWHGTTMWHYILPKSMLMWRHMIPCFFNDDMPAPHAFSSMPWLDSSQSQMCFTMQCNAMQCMIESWTVQIFKWGQLDPSNVQMRSLPTLQSLKWGQVDPSDVQMTPLQPFKCSNEASRTAVGWPVGYTWAWYMSQTRSSALRQLSRPSSSCRASACRREAV